VGHTVQHNTTKYSQRIQTDLFNILWPVQTREYGDKLACVNNLPGVNTETTQATQETKPSTNPIMTNTEYSSA